MNREKYYSVRILKIFIFLFLFLFLFSFSFSISVFASPLGNAEIITSQKSWQVTHTTDTDYFVWIKEQNKQKTQICLLHKTATNINQLPLQKNLYDINQNFLEILHRQVITPQSSNLDKNYYGFCKLIDTEEYLKFGEFSTIIEYQNESKIEYQEGNLSVNLTLAKNLTGNFETYVDDIFVFYNGDSYKFGANDTENNDTRHYRYEIYSNSDTFLSFFSEYQISIIYEGNRHIFDFEDICLEEDSNCVFERIEDNKIYLTFFSDKDIDPLIQITPVGSNSISLTALSNNIIVLARTLSGDANFSIYYTDGTPIVSNQNVAGGLGDLARAKVFALNNTAFVYYYYSDTTGGSYYRIYDKNGNALSSVQTHENIGGGGGTTDNIDFSIATMTKDKVYIGYINDNTNDGEFDILYLNNFSKSDFTIENSISPADTLQNLISCNIFNSSLIFCVYFDDYGNNIKWARFYTGNNSFYPEIVVDNTAGELAEVSSIISDGRMGILHFKDNGNDIILTIGYPNGSILGSFILEDDEGEDVRVGIASTFSNELNQYVFISSWVDTNAGNIKVYVNNLSGTTLYNYTLVNDESSVNKLFDIFGKNEYLNIGLPNGTYAFAYQNSSNITLLSFYWINGSLFQGAIVDTTSPNATLISPPNQTYTNQTIWNFTLNATDNQNLSNITIYIYNESDDLINITTKNVSGTNGIFGIIYEFFTDGIFKWFYKVADWMGNTFTTITNFITIDTQAPVMNYVSPTRNNGSLIIDEKIKINVTAIDENLSIIEVFLYLENLTLLNYTNSTTSPLYFERIGCCDGIYYFNASSCDIFNHCSSLQTRQITLGNITGLSSIFDLEISQYPYADFNTSVLFALDYRYDIIPVTTANITIYFTAPNNDKSQFGLIYNSITKKYENSFTFDQIGIYYFTINSTDENFGNETLSGSLYVGNPYYITIRVYEDKEDDLYKNNFAYVTMEYTDGKYYDDTLENFITPLTYGKTYDTPVFYGEYEDGEAIIKLYEANKTYGFRVIDGIISFSSEYSVPNMTKSYGTNFFLGRTYLNGTNQTLLFYASQSEIHQYRALFNWILIGGLVLALVLAIFLLFVIPDKPIISIALSLALTILIISIRIGVWLWKGW